MNEETLRLSRVAEVSGVPVTRLRTWLDRGALTLDADDRPTAKHRFFSFRDMFKIAIVGKLGTLGVEIKDADAIINSVFANLLSRESGLTFRDSLLAVWPVETEKGMTWRHTVYPKPIKTGDHTVMDFIPLRPRPNSYIVVDIGSLGEELSKRFDKIFKSKE